MRIRRLAASYDALNRSQPVLTKGLTCGSLLGAGDLLCQTLQSTNENGGGSSSKDVDWPRAARMLFWGALCNGPAGHYWYALLDRTVKLSGTKAVITKIAADQLIFTPPLTFAYFFWTHVLSVRDGLGPALGFANENLWPTLRVNWVYWSAVHVMTFALVPLEYRVAFVAVKNFFWGSYLSWAATPEQGAATDDEPPVAQMRRLARTATH